jgi:S-(hydroxymethyl)glutathione dehydrogenase/alcohol dehydrogenase
MVYPTLLAAIGDVALDPPAAGEVRVRMTASGVCHSDLHVRDGEWPRPGPFVIGHEGAGVVTALGPGVDPDATGLRPGVAVALSWIAPCGSCRQCLAGRAWLCVDNGAVRHRMADGSTRLHGTDGRDLLAYCGLGVAGEATVTRAPPCPCRTVSAGRRRPHRCCVGERRGRAQDGRGGSRGIGRRHVGLGGVGLSVVMGLVRRRRPIVVVDRVPAKLALARGSARPTPSGRRGRRGDGASRGDRRRPRLRVRGHRPAHDDRARDPLPPGGTATLVGMTPFGEQTSFEVFPFVDGGRRILGSNYGSAVPAVDFPRYAQMHLDGRLPIERLIERRIGLDDIEDAFAAMRRGEGLRRVVAFD